MGFKVNSSFLRYLTMGALGVNQVVIQLKDLGFRPIELERYCTSNKIWSTKVKRLRLPDLLCVKTGLRIEVRAKSNLMIRMSDAPENPDRAWDAGLRDEDLVTFITIKDDEGNLQPSERAIYLEVSDLRKAIDTSRLGKPKSQSEGAERDRTWPCTVPKKAGKVISVDHDRIKTIPDSGRSQTYRLGQKKPYVKPGDHFFAGESIISGTLAHGPINMITRLHNTWDPVNLLTSQNDIDRYAASKSIPYLENISFYHLITLLENYLKIETDERVALEMASSLAKMGSEKGFEYILEKTEKPRETYIRMEAVLILAEISGGISADILENIATNEKYIKDEIRQAAVWGLGKKGCRSYDKLIQFLDDEEDDVAIHAILAFDSDTPITTINKLVDLLGSGSERQKAAICRVLQLINSDYVISQLYRCINISLEQKSWFIAAMGLLPPANVKRILGSDPLLDQLQPFFHLSESENWLNSRTKLDEFNFIAQQNI